LIDLFNAFVWLITSPVMLISLGVLSVTATTSGKQFLQGLLADPKVQALIGDTGVPGMLREAVLMRVRDPWTFLLLAAVLASLTSLIQWSWRPGSSEQKGTSSALLFVYWIGGVGLLLTFGTEFVYLRDTFGTRMNTIFKFYYQAWVMMGIAAAFGAYYILGRGEAAPGPEGDRGVVSRRAGRGRYVWAGAFALLVLAGMVYPVLAIPNKTGYFRGKPTLDGMAFLQNGRPHDYAGIRWLQDNVPEVVPIVEATGGSFSDAAFVSAFTGLPTVLGWGGHELQWRGNYDEPGKREPDIAELYRSRDPQQALALLDKYDIRYVYLGHVERRKYDLGPDTADRLARFLDTVFEQGDVHIYKR
jgi:uncharacterized membrane protein